MHLLPASIKLHLTTWILLLAFFLFVQAQQSPSPQIPSSSNAPSPTSIISSTASTPLPPSTTTFTSIYATTLTAGQARPSNSPQSQSVFLTTSTVTTVVPVPSATHLSPLPGPTVIKPPVETSLPLNTTLDPAFGILGVLLVVSGLCLAFVGHRSRWMICLVCGFYSMALLTLAIILRVGVAKAINDPDRILKGLYLLACFCCGGIGGALFVIFRNGGLLLSSSLGGFALALFLQGCKPDGLVKVEGMRYILYIILGTISFSLACSHKLQPYVLIFTSAIVGATATILGIDCFIRSNLKEFYVRNLGFDDLFVKEYPLEFDNHRWFLSTSNIIEMGVMGGLTIMAISFQSRMWSEFRASLRAMQQDDEERRLHAKAKRAAKKVFASAQRDLREWEERHGYRKTAGRAVIEPEKEMDMRSVTQYDAYRTQELGKSSALSLLPPTLQPLDNEIIGTPKSQYEPTLVESMGLKDAAYSRPSETAQRHSPQGGMLSAEQQKLLDEIATIRKSIDVLKSSSPRTSLNQNSSPSDRQVSNSFEASRKLSMQAPFRQTDENVTKRSTSPWLTTDRSRSRSISHALLNPVDSDLFARPKQDMDGTASPSSLDLDSPFSTSSVPHVPAPLLPSADETAQRHNHSKSLDYIRTSFTPALSTVEEPERASFNMPTRPRDDIAPLGRPGLPPLAALRHQNPTQTNTRTIVETKEASAARYAKALDREEAGRKSLSAAEGGIAPVRRLTMSMGELQARHEERLKAMQQPTSERVTEEARLQKAKEEWTLRGQREKRQWEENARLSKSATPPPPLRANKDSMQQRPSPRRSARVDSLPLSNQTGPLEALEAMPEQSSLSKTKQWRKSLPVDEVTGQSNTHASKLPSPKLLPTGNSRRHSNHRKTLLDFNAETTCGDGKI